MLTYHYDENTKEYTHTEEAFLDPLESKVQGKEVYLLPANATFTKPIEKQAGYVPVWNGNEWQLIVDKRGEKFWLLNDGYGTPARTMTELGDFPPNAVFNEPPKPAPTEEEIQAELTNAVQSYMDTTAQTRGYDNIHTAASYANSTDEIFRAEGTACLQWRDNVWRKCYDILAEVKAGTRPIPTVEELFAELPTLEW